MNDLGVELFVIAGSIIIETGIVEKTKDESGPSEGVKKL